MENSKPSGWGRGTEIESRINRAHVAFKLQVESVGGSFSQAFPVLPGVRPGEDILSVLDDERVGLLECVTPTGQHEVNGTIDAAYTLEDLRRAAEAVTHDYPQVRFDFQQDHNMGMVMYNAHIIPGA